MVRSSATATTSTERPTSSHNTQPAPYRANSSIFCSSIRRHSEATLHNPEGDQSASMKAGGGAQTPEKGRPWQTAQSSRRMTEFAREMNAAGLAGVDAAD